MKQHKIGIFVDVQNVYYTCRDAYGQSLNYRQLFAECQQRGDLVIANAYAISPQDDGQHKFQDALKYMGFEVKRKPFIQRSDGSAKGDWDVGITIDIMEAASRLDEVMLVSGDGDFAILLAHVAAKYPLSTHVCSVPALTAKALTDVAHYHSPILLCDKNAKVHLSPTK